MIYASASIIAFITRYERLVTALVLAQSRTARPERRLRSRPPTRGRSCRAAYWGCRNAEGRRRSRPRAAARPSAAQCSHVEPDGRRAWATVEGQSQRTFSES